MCEITKLINYMWHCEIMPVRCTEPPVKWDNELDAFYRVHIGQRDVTMTSHVLTSVWPWSHRRLVLAELVARDLMFLEATMHEITCCWISLESIWCIYIYFVHWTYRNFELMILNLDDDRQSSKGQSYAVNLAHKPWFILGEVLLVCGPRWSWSMNERGMGWVFLGHRS